MQDPDPSDPYADIRPFVDSEVPGVIRRLAENPELTEALARLRLPELSRRWLWLARMVIKLWLKNRARSLQSIRDVQLLVKPNLERAMQASSASFTAEGLDALSAEQSYLFISNHRDIAMDPALANYALHTANYRTVNIAIGDNLLSKDWVSDIMRLNKSFIVKRNISAPRELMAASKHLSSFIRDTIVRNQGPVWIAQREGRAKDGIDATEPAVIKMLSLSRDRKTETVAEVLGQLNIVPLSIAYEIDPCDARKAAELAGGSDYKKSEHEDVSSIAAGITGHKGCVHLTFGSPIPGGEVDDVVAALDQQIIDNYTLFPTNQWAWERVNGRSLPQGVTIAKGSVSEHAFHARIDAMPAEHQPFALAMYANPVNSRLARMG